MTQRDVTELELTNQLDGIKPFGHGFEEPKFCIEADIAGARFYNDKQTGEPRHTAVTIAGARGAMQKVMFFNEVHKELVGAKRARFVVSASRNRFRGKVELSLMGHDFET